MAELTSMKLSKAEQKEAAQPAMTDGPAYPYGLTVNLEDDALEMLEMKTLPKVGATLMLYARVKVTSVSSYEAGEAKRRSVSLQITDLCLEADKGGKDADTKLYGKAKS
jgi:hypothetical protein